jgi:glycerophosphoryl diester phosphodiesterase
VRGRMTKTLSVLVAAVAGALIAAPAASAAITPYPGENPWMDRHFLNIAHQGGEDEVPSATMYALKTAMTEGGADMLEIDVQLTSNGRLVVIHDDTWTRTGCHPDDMPSCPNPPGSNLPGDGDDPAVVAAANAARAPFQIRSHTLAEVRQVDAGYWFRPNSYSHVDLPDSEFPFRGIATGDREPPPGFTSHDFRIPTLEEVLNTFPDVPINIEIKMPKSYEPENPYVPPLSGAPCGDAAGLQLCDDLDLTVATTAALIDVMNQPEYAERDDVIVVSFAEPPMEQFADGAPHVHRAPSAQELADYILAGLDADPGTDPTLDPDPAAFQVPPMESIFAVPNILLGEPFNAHENNRAVHVFTDGDQDETEARYQEFYDLGVDGLMTSRPRALHAFLCAQEIPRPDGSDRCPPPVQPEPPVQPQQPAAKKKKCKKGKKLKRGKCVKKKRKKGKKK